MWIFISFHVVKKASFVCFLWWRFHIFVFELDFISCICIMRYIIHVVREVELNNVAWDYFSVLSLRRIGVPLSDDENEDEIEVDSFRAGGSSAASSSQSVSQSSMPPSASSSLSASPSGSLLPPPKQRPGNSYLSVTIDKVASLSISFLCILFFIQIFPLKTYIYIIASFSIFLRLVSRMRPLTSILLSPSLSSVSLCPFRLCMHSFQYMRY